MKTLGAVAYSATNPEHRLEVEETEGGVLLVVKGDTVNGVTATIGITINGDDLVRALITASPSVVNSIGLIAKKMIQRVLDDQ